jgi:hypothetical protein
MFMIPTDSIAQIQKSARNCGRHLRRWLPLAIACPGTLLTVQAAWAYPEIEFAADSVEYGETSLRDVQFRLDGQGQFLLGVGTIEAEGKVGEIAGLSLKGSVREALVNGDSMRILLAVRALGIDGDLELEKTSTAYSAELNVADLEVATLQEQEAVPDQIDWISRGNIDISLKLQKQEDRSPDISYTIGMEDLAFDSPDGRFAAEGLYLDAVGSVSGDEMSSTKIAGSVQRGELLIDDFYRDFADGAMQFSLEPDWLGSALDIRSIRLTDNHALTIEGRAKLHPDREQDAWELEMNRLDLVFPGAYQRYLEPVAAAWTLDGLAVTGRISWSGLWSDGKFHSGNLEITDLTIVDTLQGRFAFTGLETRLRPGDHSFDSKLTWQGLLFGRINLGRGEAALDSEPGTIALVKPLFLDVLGGRLNLHELKIVLPGRTVDTAREPDIQLRADLEALDMEQLTAALDWPLFSGQISGHIPGVRLEDGVLDVDGEILVNVFDGLVSLEDLRVERPFGVLPSLAANVKATGLDLEMLTGAFSFGRISGRLDGYVEDLRMLDWKPVAFDAWLGTPEQQRGSNGISRQAVNHLTTLGGGRATTALTSPIMRMFNNFSYRRLGMGCRLQNNVCEIRGVSEDDVSVLIMEGAGVPKIMIRAHNRRVDWPQLVADLVAVSGEESIRIGD